MHDQLGIRKGLLNSSNAIGRYTTLIEKQLPLLSTALQHQRCNQGIQLVTVLNALWVALKAPVVCPFRVAKGSSKFLKERVIANAHIEKSIRNLIGTKRMN